MGVSKVIKSNRTQTVRLPADMRFPDCVKSVEVRAVGNERIIAPVDQAWDRFFLGTNLLSEDFMTVRASQDQPERAAL